MQILQAEANKKGKLYVEINGQQLAELQYRLTAPCTITIDHTEVNSLLKGQNIGYQLVQQAAGYARQNNYKIIALCPFAHTIMHKKIAEFKDVLKA